MRHDHRRRRETIGRVTSVTINRAEGPTKLCGPRTFGSIGEATRYLRGQAHTFPGPHRGYDKHDFTVNFRGGSWKGRLDCKAARCPDNDLDMAQHMRDVARFERTGRRPGRRLGGRS